MAVEQEDSGIYYLIGDAIPIQLVIVPKLSKEHNYWLNNLRNDLKAGSEIKKITESGSNTTRRQAFREAKEAAGIPKSAEYKTHKFVFDGTSENRIVYEFDVCGEKKYIIEHPFDKMGRGNHFHGADDTKGSPFSKGRYNQYPGHFPEDFNGFN